MLPLIACGGINGLAIGPSCDDFSYMEETLPKRRLVLSGVSCCRIRPPLLQLPTCCLRQLAKLPLPLPRPLLNMLIADSLCRYASGACCTACSARALNVRCTDISDRAEVKTFANFSEPSLFNRLEFAENMNKRQRYELYSYVPNTIPNDCLRPDFEHHLRHHPGTPFVDKAGSTVGLLTLRHRRSPRSVASAISERSSISPTP